MVIVITGILAAMTTDIITLPVNSYLDLERRTTLVDTAELTLRRMQRDVRRALPNSIRITGGGKVIEMLHTVDGGRYRASADGTKAAGTGLCDGDPASDSLSFAAADDCFELLGNFKTFNPQTVSGESLVIYNLGAGAADAYAGGNRTTLTDSGNASTVKFNALKFPFSSPQQRFFIIDTPVTYRCDTSTGNLWRYSGYAISTAQPNPPGVAGQLQANKIAACSFAYSAGEASRSALVTIELTVTDMAGESVRLLHQIHVDNMP